LMRELWGLMEGAGGKFVQVVPSHVGLGKRANSPKRFWERRQQFKLHT
jgi:hypothetical protein